MLTVEQIRAICPQAPKNVDVFIPYLNKYMAEYGINTVEEIRMFLAQVAHESGQFRYTQEIASGKAYEGRKDLGNIYPGDGVKFKGHGLFQTTGRENHRLAGIALGLDLINHPELLTVPEYAVKSACYYWKSKGLDRHANDIVSCTKKINGGKNGLADRKMFWERTKKAIQ